MNPDAAVGGMDPDAAVGGMDPDAAVGGMDVDAAVGGMGVDAAVGGMGVDAAVGGMGVDAAVGGMDIVATDISACALEAWLCGPDAAGSSSSAFLAWRLPSAPSAARCNETASASRAMTAVDGGRSVSRSSLPGACAIAAGKSRTTTRTSSRGVIATRRLRPRSICHAQSASMPAAPKAAARAVAARAGRLFAGLAASDGEGPCDDADAAAHGEGDGRLPVRASSAASKRC